jgi:chemotaxis methyl-accepting protein methylase
MSRRAVVPDFSPEGVTAGLSLLLREGRLDDADLERRIGRLDERFRVYATTCPHPHWAPGLHVTPGMRTLTELYLPHAEIRRAFERLLSLAMTAPPVLSASLLHSCDNWLDVLRHLGALVSHPNPALLLRRLMKDGDLRNRVIFALFLPRHYGCDFDRYPGQTAFLAHWLVENRGRLGGGTRCLDAACGCGEGTYGLAALLPACGYPASETSVAGTSLEPVELFAAAHGWFPHDRERQRLFRQRVEPLLAGERPQISFQLEDLASVRDEGKEFDVILCNGLLGGPMLHEVERLQRTITGLARRLAPGGLLLASDRFHEGWKRRVPKQRLEEMLRLSGLQVVEAGEGIGGERPGGWD